MAAIVAAQASGAGRQRALFENLAVGPALPSCDKENAPFAQLGEPLVIVVTAVEDHDRAAVERHLAGRRQVGRLGAGDDAETGQIAVVVEYQMQFDGAFGPWN